MGAIDHQLLAHLMTALAALTAFAVAHAGASVGALPRPRRGHRGSERVRALAQSAPFRVLEPAVRQLAGWIAELGLPSAAHRRALDRHLAWAGQHLGLDAAELISLTVLSAVLGAPVAFAACAQLELGMIWGALATVFITCLPWLSLRERQRTRTREIDRRLPGALDLAVLCVGAGMDLRSALALITTNGVRDALADELDRVLAELAMGRTREQALRGLSARVRSDAVRDFTTAVIQAELKGTPLSEALGVQARVARGRRSVAAEEAAAHASVLLALPLLLLLCCVLLLLFGPFIVTGGGF